MVLHINVSSDQEVIQVIQLMIEVEEVRLVVEDHLVLIVMMLALLVLVRHFSMHHHQLIVIMQCFLKVY